MLLYLDHQLQQRIPIEHVLVRLRVAVLVHQRHQRLLRRVVRVLESNANGAQSFIGLDHLVARHAAGRTLVLDILHDATHALREFADQVRAACGLIQNYVYIRNICIKSKTHLIKNNLKKKFVRTAARTAVANRLGVATSTAQSIALRSIRK